MLSTDKSLKNERLEEAKHIVKNKLVDDVAGVFDAAQPIDAARCQLANEISRRVCADLEAYIRTGKVAAPPTSVAARPNAPTPGSGRSTPAGSSAAQAAADMRRLHVSDAPQPASTRPMTRSQNRLPAPRTLPMTAAEQSDAVARLTQRPTRRAAAQLPETRSASQASRARPLAAAPATNTYKRLVGWVNMNSANAAVKGERVMYPAINSFVTFVASRVSAHLSEPGLARSILPFERTDVVPEGADDKLRIDHMLTGCPRDGPIVDPDYAEALCLIEAKFDPKDQKQAYLQVVMYSRNIYSRQPHRRFLWGLTVCGTRVRACLLGHDKIHVSTYVDVFTPAGRTQFATLLVNWSLCESARLGYDPTMRPSDTDDGWAMDVFGDGMKRTYSNLRLKFKASSLLGRHTRCFVGTAKVDGASKEFLIKDCWPHVVEDGTDGKRDELTFLREIRDKLRGDSDLDGKYPVLEIGGIVRIAGIGDATLEDTTATVVAGLDGTAGMPRRAHTRIVMSPVGAPLDTVLSPDELIIVTCDAMEVHTALVRRCGILHRDISTNNILVRRLVNGVGGMLIDLDNAIRMTGDHVAVRPDRTGTLPYMSIGNLEGSIIKRTALDDWESDLYILCWLGTIGVNRGDQSRNKTPMMAYEINNWRNGNSLGIARAKRAHMETMGIFAGAILSGFIRDPRYSHLRRLAENLHQMLFCNPKASPLCHGSYADPKYLARAKDGTVDLGEFYDADVSLDITDPFARRAEIVDRIVDDLMATYFKARDEARMRMPNARLLDTISEETPE